MDRSEARRPDRARPLGPPPWLAVVWTVLFVVAAIATVPTARGDSSGYLAPPHADRGLDTNSDRLYNYLQLDVRIEVTGAGRFALHVVLNDPWDLAPLTDAVTTVSLVAGTAVVPVYVNGPDIYNGFLDGPYYTHITLKSEFGSVLSTGTHRTAAYKYTSFQPYAIRFVSPTSERGIDNDSDGLYDWLALTLSLDVATEDSYVIASLLVDQRDVVAERWRTTVRLLPGRSNVIQFFLGYPLRLANASGPFLVANELYDGRSVLADFLLHTTAAYLPSQFEGPPVILSPPHADRGVDTDGDGLYSHLEVSVRLTAERTSAVSLEGELRSGDGVVLIQAVTMETTVAKGPATVALYFAGPTIYSKGLDGPYQVRLRVRDGAGRLLSEGVHTTQFYGHTQFEPRVLQLNRGQHVDYGVDVDGNGKYDVLRLDVNATVDVSGTFVFDATLWDGSMLVAIAGVSRQLSLVAGPWTVAIDFPGFLINASRIDGPYRVTIQVRDTRDGSLADTGAHKTRGYLVSDFEANAVDAILGIVKEERLDSESVPDGYANILRVVLSVSVRASGVYRLDATLSAAGTTIASSSATAPLPVGFSSAAVSFSGWEIRSSQRDGPYTVLVSLWNRDAAAPLVRNASFLTAVYGVTTFQPVASAALSGYVSSYGGRPLADAEILAVNYSNAFSRRAFSDDDGGHFTLSLPAAIYQVVVDHPTAQAQRSQLAVPGAFAVNFTLFPARPNAIRTEIVWLGWQQMIVSAKYIFDRDVSALRLRLDWDGGDRDGIVEPFEEASLPALPFAPAREALESRSTASFLLVNGADYVAQGGSLYDDFILGGVAGDTPPAYQFRSAFVLNFTLGLPPRVALAVRVMSDTLDWARADFLSIPGGYRYALHYAPTWASVYARKNPYVVDPQIDPNSTQVAAVADVELLLSLKPSALATPSPPGGPVARVEGADVLLEWTAPRTNTDGSPIANLAGYTIYRSSSSGSGYVRVNPILVTTTSYRDAGLPAGTYYYVVTAMNTDGQEGPFSTEVSASVLVASTTEVTAGRAHTLPPSGLILAIILVPGLMAFLSYAREVDIIGRRVAGSSSAGVAHRIPHQPSSRLNRGSATGNVPRHHRRRSRI